MTDFMRRNSIGKAVVGRQEGGLRSSGLRCRSVFLVFGRRQFSDTDRDTFRWSDGQPALSEVEGSRPSWRAWKGRKGWTEIEIHFLKANFRDTELQDGRSGARTTRTITLIPQCACRPRNRD